MATINLGSIKFNWRGDYAAGTSYSVDDVVNSSGTSYVCIAATTGNAPPNATYWNVMAQGGTDVGTTLTTQGDILYRNASGLARLGAGTSGQVLQTGGSGANPSWTNISSDFVKLASTTVSSNVSSVSLTGVFDDTTYASYYLRINNAQTELTSTNRGNIIMRVNTSGGAQSGGSDYIYSGFYGYRRWDTNTQVTDTFFSEGASHIALHNWGLSANDAQNTDMWFANPQATDKYKIFNISTTAWRHTSTGSDGPYNFSPHNNIGVYQQTTAITGFTFYPNSSGATAIAAGNFSLYGLKR